MSQHTEVDPRLAFERWVYDQGRAAGAIEGHRRGYDEGYEHGFAAALASACGTDSGRRA